MGSYVDNMASKRDQVCLADPMAQMPNKGVDATVTFPTSGLDQAQNTATTTALLQCL